MPAAKTADLADWRVHFTTPTSPVTIRASYLKTREGVICLEDATGKPLFMAPPGCVLFVRRMEPREDRPRGVDQALVDAVADEVERRQREQAAK